MQFIYNNTKIKFFFTFFYLFDLNFFKIIKKIYLHKKIIKKYQLINKILKISFCKI